MEKGHTNSHVWEVKCEEGGGIRSGVLKKKKKSREEFYLNRQKFYETREIP